MFENGKPVPQSSTARYPGGSARADGVLIGRKAQGSTSLSGGALRLIDWNELTARLNASRDLRTLLKREETVGFAGASGSFVDAAARYFRTRDESADSSGEAREPVVNSNALEPSKCSPGIAFEHDEPRPPDTESGVLVNGQETGSDDGYAETGDARED